MDEATSATLFTTEPTATALLSEAQPTSPHRLGASRLEFGLGDLPALRRSVERLLLGFDGNRGIREAQRFQEWAANLETRLLAQKVNDGADERSLRHLAGAGGTRPKSEVEKRKRRARTTAKNPDVAPPSGDDPLKSHPADAPSEDDWPAGHGATDGSGSGRIILNGSQLDALGWADDRTEGAAAFDPDLLRLLSKLGADQAMREARRYVQDHQKVEAERRQERQRVQRRAYRSSDGEIDKITLEGDTGSLDEIWSLIDSEADRLYGQDGGREVPDHLHPRTRNQRLFDAAQGFFARAATGAKTVRTAATRATLVLTTSVENAAAGFPDPVDLVGTGPISREFLSRILPDTDLAGLLFGRDGHPLWLGRSLRHATFPQWLALAIRDRGCVLCDAKPIRCQAHHTRRWESPSRGGTNIDEMCLLCGDCHQQLHHDRQTLVWDAEIRRWRQRPARPEEIPATRATTRRE